jgi:hypothetical protein
MSWEEEKDRRNKQALMPAHEELAQHFSACTTSARTRPAIRTPDTAAGDRLLLASASNSR